MANALTVSHGTTDLMFMPVMDMEVAIARRNFVVEFTRKIMVDGTDYGKIPGAGDKPTLLKPGAEKLATVFGLTPMFVPVAVTEDWTGDEHKGEPFFYYRYRCELHRNGNLVASSEGSCNTWESKYRYRKGERVCPNCGQAAIIKGKAEYGGGWVCFKKKGGCDAKFKDGDIAIEKQEVGRILNPDVADQVNTVQKMAQKRALIAATLLAVNASEFFTQDIEDMVIDGDWTSVAEKPSEPKANEAKPAKAQSKPSQMSTEPSMDNPFDDAPPMEPTKTAVLTDAELKRLNTVGVDLYGKDEWEEQRPKLVKAVSNGKVESSKQLTSAQATQLIRGMEKKLKEVAAIKAQQAAEPQPQPVAA